VVVWAATKQTVSQASQTNTTGAPFRVISQSATRARKSIVYTLTSRQYGQHCGKLPLFLCIIDLLVDLDQIPHKKQPKWKKVNSSSELNKLKSKLKTIDINNKEQRTQIQRQIQVLVDQQRQFKQEKENKEIRRILKKAKIDQTRHVISKLKKLQADPSTDPTLVKDSERNLLELKVRIITRIFTN
jgi:hypothetical protein